MSYAVKNNGSGIIRRNGLAVIAYIVIKWVIIGIAGVYVQELEWWSNWYLFALPICVVAITYARNNRKRKLLSETRLRGIPRLHLTSPNATVIMGSELCISTSKEQLNDCLQKISCAHPLIRKVVEIDESNDARLVEDPIAQFEIIQYSGQSYETIVRNHLKEEWNLAKPLIKFIVNHLNGNRCQVIVVANHSICDGLSMVYLLEDIAAYLAKGVTPVNNETVMLHPSLMKIRYWFVPERLFMLYMNSALRKTSFSLSQEVISDVSKVYWEKHCADFQSLIFDKSQTAKIINAAKKSNVTVNTYLTCLLYESQLNLSDRVVREEIMISVNLRDKLFKSPGRQFGYFVTGVRMSLTKFSNAARLDNIRALQKAIERKLRPRSISQSLAAYFLSPLFLDLVQLNKFGCRSDRSIQKFIAKKEAKKIGTAFAFTNLGVIEVNENCKDTLSRFLPLVLVLDSIGKYVSAFTYNGELQVTVCYDSSLISENYIDNFTRALKMKLLD